jgi:hypothetical protein
VIPLPFAVEIPEVNNLKTEDLSPEQLTRLFKAIEADPHAQAGPMMKMALFTGLRFTNRVVKARTLSFLESSRMLCWV